MNQKELIRARTINKSKLEPSSWKNIDRVEIDIGNSIEHELTKTVCFILLKKGVPAEQLPKFFDQEIYGMDTYTNPMWHVVKTLIDTKDVDIDSVGGMKQFIEKYGQKFKDWERPVIVTEARFKTIHRQVGHIHENILETEGKEYPVWTTKTRRADLFILSSGIEEDCGKCIEIETDDKIKKEGAITVYI